MKTQHSQKERKKESACQCRGHGFDPWSEKIPHASGQLSPCATTAEPVCCNSWSPVALESLLCNKRSHLNEKPTRCNEDQPPLAAIREKPSSSKDPAQPKEENPSFALPPTTLIFTCLSPKPALLYLALCCWSWETANNISQLCF